MTQKYRYHYDIQVDIETLEAGEYGVTIAKLAFGESRNPILYFDTNTRLVKGELLEVHIRNNIIVLELTKIVRCWIKCNDGERLSDTRPHTTDYTDEIWFDCKANASHY